MVTRRDVVRLALALPFLGFANAVAAQQQPRFYVIGLVRKAGVYKHEPDITVADAINMAGGYSPNRIVTGIEIIRMVDGEKKTLGASLTDAVLANDTVQVR